MNFIKKFMLLFATFLLSGCGGNDSTQSITPILGTWKSDTSDHSYIFEKETYKHIYTSSSNHFIVTYDYTLDAYEEYDEKKVMYVFKNKITHIEEIKGKVTSDLYVGLERYPAFWFESNYSKMYVRNVEPEDIFYRGTHRETSNEEIEIENNSSYCMDDGETLVVAEGKTCRDGGHTLTCENGTIIYDDAMRSENLININGRKYTCE